MSWCDDFKLTSRGTIRSGSGWMDELMKDASKTLAIGAATHEGVLGLYMRVGVCPTCGARVERGTADVFFPYCSYSCKRVEQRKEEEAERERIERQDRKYIEQKKRDNAKTRAKKRKAREAKMLDNLRAYIETAKLNYSEASKNAAYAPKNSADRRREANKAHRWYKKIVDAQMRLKELEAQEYGKGIVQGHEQVGVACHAGAGHEQSGDCGCACSSLHDGARIDRETTEGAEEKSHEGT